MNFELYYFMLIQDSAGKISKKYWNKQGMCGNIARFQYRSGALVDGSQGPFGKGNTASLFLRFYHG